MREVEYVLFKDALTFNVPRGGENDYYSMCAGPDTRYSTVQWSLWFDATIACVLIGCADGKTGERGKVTLVPVTNCRQIQLTDTDPIVAKIAPVAKKIDEPEVMADAKTKSR